MNNKTTIADFVRFKKECEYWIDCYGLKDWRIYFEHVELEPLETSARAEADLENRLARITLNTVWVEIKPTNILLAEVAYHEVCHILLHRLTEMAITRDAPRKEIENEVSVIIRRLENAKV